MADWQSVLGTPLGKMKLLRFSTTTTATIHSTDGRSSEWVVGKDMKWIGPNGKTEIYYEMGGNFAQKTEKMKPTEIMTHEEWVDG